MTMYSRDEIYHLEHRDGVDEQATPNPSFNDIPDGVWCEIPILGDLCELTTVPLAWLDLPEGDFSVLDHIWGKDINRYYVAKRYAEWWEQGHTPPPIHIVQTTGGTLRVMNGHHRAAAAKLRGLTHIRAWVAWVVPHGVVGRGIDREWLAQYGAI